MLYSFIPCFCLSSLSSPSVSLLSRRCTCPWRSLFHSSFSRALWSWFKEHVSWSCFPHCSSLEACWPSNCVFWFHLIQIKNHIQLQPNHHPVFAKSLQERLAIIFILTEETDGVLSQSPVLIHLALWLFSCFVVLFKAIESCHAVLHQVMWKNWHFLLCTLTHQFDKSPQIGSPPHRARRRIRQSHHLFFSSSCHASKPHPAETGVHSKFFSPLAPLWLRADSVKSSVKCMSQSSRRVPGCVTALVIAAAWSWLHGGHFPGDASSSTPNGFLVQPVGLLWSPIGLPQPALHCRQYPAIHAQQVLDLSTTICFLFALVLALSSQPCESQSKQPPDPLVVKKILSEFPHLNDAPVTSDPRCWHQVPSIGSGINDFPLTCSWHPYWSVKSGCQLAIQNKVSEVTVPDSEITAAWPDTVHCVYSGPTLTWPTWGWLATRPAYSMCSRWTRRLPVTTPSRACPERSPGDNQTPINMMLPGPGKKASGPQSQYIWYLSCAGGDPLGSDLHITKAVTAAQENSQEILPRWAKLATTGKMRNGLSVCYQSALGRARAQWHVGCPGVLSRVQCSLPSGFRRTDWIWLLASRNVSVHLRFLFWETVNTPFIFICSQCPTSHHGGVTCHQSEWPVAFATGSAIPTLWRQHRSMELKCPPTPATQGDSWDNERFCCLLRSWYFPAKHIFTRGEIRSKLRVLVWNQGDCAFHWGEIFWDTVFESLRRSGNCQAYFVQIGAAESCPQSISTWTSENLCFVMGLDQTRQVRISKGEQERKVGCTWLKVEESPSFTRASVTWNYHLRVEKGTVGASLRNPSSGTSTVLVVCHDGVFIYVVQFVTCSSISVQRLGGTKPFGTSSPLPFRTIEGVVASCRETGVP